MSADNFPSQAKPGQQPISYAAEQQRSPAGRLWLFYAPQDEHGSFAIQKRDDDSLSRFVGYRDFIVDQYSGEIRAEYAPLHRQCRRHIN